MINNQSISCPWCGATFDTVVDCSAGDQIYTEDCHVCCQPIVFSVETDAHHLLIGITVQRENE
ncbi:MAG: CPXCG motif-containing cysteine-rich protein [Proteobacteria bacterium]|nr:CPXCG motif-containing cysteine-rich protein [Pseudomonadota bacterium]MCG6934543.1 CPXCG motif-containing cysteine-rich protein [Pseudomonadota bacterium]